MMRSHPFLLSASQRANSIRFPAKAALQLLTTLAIFSLCLFPSFATAASPHIYDVPQAGPPGSQTTIVGNGFDPNATLDIYFDSTDVGLVDTDNNGSFGMALKAPTLRQNGLTIQIPNNAVPGQHWVTAVERITQIQAQVPFTVSADWAQFHFDAQHTGFNPFENILSPETAANLTTRWTYTTGSVETPPVVVNGVVYAGSLCDEFCFYALDASTGELLWNYPATPNQATALAVANGVVYFSSMEPDRYLYALNASTGALLWKRAENLSGTPTVANGVVYITESCNLEALNAATGALLWTYSPDCRFGVSTAATVAYGVAYVGTDYGFLYAVDTGTGTFLWKFAGTQYQGFGPPAVTNGTAYVDGGDGILYALDANTGALLWEYATGYGAAGSSPAVANGAVYVGGGDGNFYALDANNGALRWAFPTGGLPGTSPALANGVVYFGIAYGNDIFALDASTGALLWSFTTGDWIFSSPAVVNGMVYIGSLDGNLYVFGLPNQQMSEKFSWPERPDPARLTPNWPLPPSSAATPPLKKK
jgi:outer membrane protein assembly factor BamB